MVRSPHVGRACAAAAFLFAVGVPQHAYAGPDPSPGWQVNAGYDLFQTDSSATSFPGLGNLMGVALGTYDFGGAVGVQNTGETDTIIQRLNTVTDVAQTVGDTETTSLVMDALQLETVTPVNPGTGLDNYFVTLQSVRGGPTSTGSIDITWLTSESGTFSSNLDVFFDIRKGSLNGPVIDSADLVLSGTNSAWSNVAPPGVELIDSINNMLNGKDTTNDFWPGTLVESHPNGAQHTVDPALAAPEASTITSLTLFLSALGGLSLRRRLQK